MVVFHVSTFILQLQCKSGGQIYVSIRNYLLQGLLNSNSHGNGHADHGVVTCLENGETVPKLYSTHEIT